MSHPLKVVDAAWIARRCSLSVRQVQRYAKTGVLPGAVRSSDGHHRVYHLNSALQRWITDKKKYRKGRRPDLAEVAPLFRKFPRRRLIEWFSDVLSRANPLGVTTLTKRQITQVRAGLKFLIERSTLAIEELDKATTLLSPGRTSAERERFDNAVLQNQLLQRQVTTGLPKQRPLRPWRDY